jgi:hypothetical protein
MFDRGKDLSPSRSKTDKDLTPDFTYEELQKEIWADIDSKFALPVRMSGDIDVTQIMERYGGHENTARGRMKALVATGEWEFVIVADESTNRGRRKIIRKIIKC